MYKIYLYSMAILAVVISSNVYAENDSNWFRHSAISPDGKTILFTAKGDIYQVSSEGGEANVLVSDSAWDGYPVWSNDGKSIAFASDRNGGLDVYVMNLEDQRPQRLTFHVSDDYPTDFSNDDQSIIFSSGRLPSAKSSNFPTTRVHQLYSISVSGGTPSQILSSAAMQAKFSPDGEKLIYMDNKSYEDIYRKHDVSSFARDIWAYDFNSKSHKQLTDFEGADSAPLWSTSGDTIYFLSEKKTNNFNVWQMNAKGKKQKQLTDFTLHPVRDLSISDDSVLAYSWHGNIYTQNINGEPTLLSIKLNAPRVNLTEQSINIVGNADYFAVSPNGKEVAFTARGELFVSSVKYGTTARITDTSEQERNMSWFPDNRSIAYAAEKDGVWGIYKASLADENELYFFASTKLDKETLIKSEIDAFQPLVSPDGEKIAYLHQRDEIRVFDIESGTSSIVFPAKSNYSYSDGDISFDWSPDSEWIVATFSNRGFLFMPEIGIAPADGSQAPIDVTLSGYSEFMPQWTSKDMITFVSDRYGERAHGSWGTEYDVMALFLTQEAFDDYNMSKEDRALRDELETKQKEDKEKTEEAEEETSSNSEEGTENSDEKPEDEEASDEKDKVVIDWKGLDERTIRLTKHSSDLDGFAVTPDMKKLYYLAKFEKGYDLWVQDFEDKSTKLALKLNARSASLEMSEDGESAILLANGSLSKLSLGGSVTRKNISINHHVSLKEDAEREYLFKHIWRQTKDKFYNPDMHGIDWDKMYDEYLPKVKGVNNNRDFSVLASELLGELNASHTGARYFKRPSGANQTGFLGLLFESNSDALVVEEILPYSPLLKHSEMVKQGSVLTAVNGQAVNAQYNVFQALNGSINKRTRLTFVNGEESNDIVVRPHSFGDELSALYKRWVDSRRAYVEEISDGKLAYVHIPQMNDSAYRMVHKELFGRGFDKQGVVVDTRFNRGGWLTDDLVTLLSGNHYSWLSARGEKYKGNSMDRWTKPSVLVVNEGNYSDGYCFPTGYRANKIGKIVGMPVPGTCTAVWWERLQTGDLVFGIPQLGVLNKDGSYMENKQLEPDIKVENSKESVANGEDEQLRRAVKVLLK